MPAVNPDDNIKMECKYPLDALVIFDVVGAEFVIVFECLDAVEADSVN